MGNPIINGNLGVITQPTEWDFDPQRGAVVRFRYKSAGGANPLIYPAAWASDVGWRGRMVVNPFLSELEIESPEGNALFSDYARDTWQVVGQGSAKSVFEDPVTQSQVSLNDRIVIARMLSKGMTAKDAITDLKSDPVYAALPAFTEPADPAALQLFHEVINKQQDSFSDPQYVLRHTTNCSPGYSGNVSDFNVLSIYTTAQLLSEAGSRNLWKNPLPGRLVTKILSIPVKAAQAEEAAYYVWGWLKQPSTEATMPNNRIEVTTEYTLDLWSTLRYTVAS